MGETDEVIAQYLAAMDDRAAPGQPLLERAVRPSITRVDSIPNIDDRHGDQAATILGIAVTNEFGEPLHLMTPDSRIAVRITFRANKYLARLEIGFVLRNHLGLDFSVTSHALPAAAAGETVTLEFELEIPELYPGAFSFSALGDSG